MAYKNLKEFLEILEKEGQLLRIKQEVLLELTYRQSVLQTTRELEKLLPLCCLKI